MPFKRSELKQKDIKCVGRWVVAIWRFVVSNKMWVDSDKMSTNAHTQPTNMATDSASLKTYILCVRSKHTQEIQLTRVGRTLRRFAKVGPTAALQPKRRIKRNIIKKKFITAKVQKAPESWKLKEATTSTAICVGRWRRWWWRRASEGDMGVERRSTCDVINNVKRRVCGLVGEFCPVNYVRSPNCQWTSTMERHRREATQQEAKKGNETNVKICCGFWFLFTVNLQVSFPQTK